MDDYFDDYFEDFEQDLDSGETSKKQSAKVLITPPKATEKNTKRKTMKKSVLATGTSPKDRLLSSKEHELREVQNRLSATNRQLLEIQKENKMLKRLQIRQEKELSKISTLEGELPMILQKHNNEVKFLKSQLRQSQLNNLDLKKKQSEMSDELWRANERKKKLESLCKRRDLIERGHLMMELQDTHETLKRKDRRIQELEKAIELTNKTHSQEVKSLLTKQKQLQQSLANAKQDTMQFRQQLKEKERLLDVTNIYTQRVPHTSLPPPLPSIDDNGTQTPLTHPPGEEMVLARKCHTITAESQTESNWMISPKRTVKTSDKQCSTQDNPIGSFSTNTVPQIANITTMSSALASKPTTVNYGGFVQPVITTTNVDKPNPVAQVVQPLALVTTTSEAPITAVVNTRSTTTPDLEDEPIMDLSKPIVEVTPPIGPPPPQLKVTPPTQSNVTPPTQSNVTPPTHPAPLPTQTHRPLNFQELLQSGQREVAPKTSQAIPTRNEGTKGSLGTKEKDDLLKKLFTNQYTTPTTSHEVMPTNKTPSTSTARRQGIEYKSEQMGLFGEINGLEDVGKKDIGGTRTVKKDNGAFGTNTSMFTDTMDTGRRQKHTAATIVGDSRTTKDHNGTTDSVFGQRGGAMVTNGNNQRSDNRRNTSKSDFLSKLFDTSKNEKETVDTTHDGVKSDNGSATSVLSRSERIRNMHQGLPSMASEDDPYGAKKKIVKDTSASRTTAKYGRRVNEPTVANGVGAGLLFGSDKTEEGNLQLGGMSDTNKVGGAYPWETHVDVQSRSRGFLVDDDLEEVTI